MTAAFEKNPPDYVLFVEWNAYEFGVNNEFGHSSAFGLELMQWIKKITSRSNCSAANLFKKTDCSG